MTNHNAPLAIAFDVDETLVSTGGAGLFYCFAID